MNKGKAFKNLGKLVQRFRDELNQQESVSQKAVINHAISVILLYAYNRTGKTRLSMEFKDFGKRKSKKSPQRTPFISMLLPKTYLLGRMISMAIPRDI